VRPLPTRLLGFAALSLAIHVAALDAVGARASTVAPRTLDATARPLAGETLDIDPPVLVSVAAPAPAPAPTPLRAPATVSAAVRTPAAAGAGAPAPPPVFGAVGARFATDLATTFTRAIPQAASADPTWSSAQFGNAGRADVTLALDAEGHLVASDVTGSPFPALRRSIERTLALLATRAFTSRGAITVLRVTAHVSRNDARDGLRGDVFALSGGSFSGDVGSAFFALPPGVGPGRRVDVQVRLMP
jgi:hypothetical protein